MPYLTLHIISPQVAGAVVLVPHTQDINDTAFVVLTFAEEEAFSKEFSSDRVRTIYSLNNNFINPQGITENHGSEELPLNASS